ncbi:type II toxin-antitoxin system RelE/ParE family toxin [Nocardia farcinica]|uniref:type II toxin-antitoxin system RelE/ParE family toxin n=1 Tax=Nocardia farcinica TaxID=37329 RepID=UPI0024553B81|nr:type II toxin-antitoxin system RelE/ParE family toxin [Nocardia farcinica]
MKGAPQPKPVRFIGRALNELRDFPKEAREDAGYQIHLVQIGETPPTSKAVPDIGKGVRELRVAENDSWFRVLYVAELAGKVCVLHAFQKKSNQMPKTAKDTGKTRYRQALDDASTTA